MLNKEIVWYICGPMTGLPRFNYPMFRLATAHLRELGHTVVSPEEMDSDLMRELAWDSPDGDASVLTKAAGETWGDVLARDVKVISDTLGGIVMLPDWFLSRGARLEVFVGLLTGKQFAVLFIDHKQDVVVEPVGKIWVRGMIADHMP
jgi:hypothetical protein